MAEYGYISALIKPASSLCNMRCEYCFYHDVASHREMPSFGIMTKEKSHKLIDRFFAAAKNGGTVNFTFQGGEPTCAGYDFFEDFVSYAKEKNDKNLILSYAMQTNGTLVDEKFCRLLAENKFLIGLSLDGPKEFHDRNRILPDGEGSFDRVMKCASLFTEYGVDFNTVSVLTEQNASHPEEMFAFFKENNFSYMQFIPCLLPLEVPYKSEKLPDYTLSATTYAAFLARFFRRYKETLMRGEVISVRLFDNVVGMYMKRMPEQCGLYGRCNNQLVIESDGSVYPCDFYVLDEYKVGNILTDSVEKLLTCEAAKKFADEIVPLNAHCNSCKYLRMCAGSCRRYRDFYSSRENFCPYENFLGRTKNDIGDIIRYLENK